jgi:hypothetical protein
MHANFQDPIPACAGMTKKKKRQKEKKKGKIKNRDMNIPVLFF